MFDGNNLPAETGRIVDIVSARNAALSIYAQSADLLEAAHKKASEAADMAKKAHNGSMFRHDKAQGADAAAALHGAKFDRTCALAHLRRDVDARIWQHLLDTTGMREMMDRQALEEFEASLQADPPEVTEETLRATLEGLSANAPLIFARGLANCFSKLDRRFKSHDAFKIGSRIVLTRVFDDWGNWNYHSKTRETLMDVERVFAKLDGAAPAGYGLIEAIQESRGRGLDPRQSLTETPYFRIRGFKNGNAHLWFTRDDLVEKANKVLAGYYGEVLPDAAPADPGEDLFRSKSGLPSKDLAFYATPDDVAQRAVRFADPYIRKGEPFRVLEPSAGVGNISKALEAAGCVVTSVEIDGDRAAVLRRHVVGPVICRNFLGMKPPAECDRFDACVMNPPFVGTHWMEHVRHALDFVKPGGTLVAILPASARVMESKKHDAFRAWAAKESREGEWGLWRDLPPESFASSGTRIQTVMLRIQRRYY